MAPVNGKKTADDGFVKLKKQLAQQQIGTLYLFHGEEAYLREYYLDRMKKALLSEGMDAFNFHPLDGEKLEMQSLLDAVNTLPVFSERSMVVVRDFDLFHGEARRREQLVELLEDLPDYVCLVFLFDVLEYKPGQEQKVKNAIRKNGVVVEFQKQSAADLIAWIKRRFAALGKKIETRECEYLLFLCDGTMSGLIPEIEKVAAYCKSEQIQRSDLEAVVTPVLDAVLFDMTDAMSAQDFQRALSLLRDLFALKYDPVPLLAAMGKQLRQLYSAKLLSRERNGERRLQELWGLRSAYPAQRLMRAAGKLRLDWCRHAVSLCEETDLKLKSLPGDRNQMLELMLLELSVEARK